MTPNDLKSACSAARGTLRRLKTSLEASAESIDAILSAIDQVLGPDTGSSTAQKSDKARQTAPRAHKSDPNDPYSAFDDMFTK